jgi:hypothetical protein
MGKERSKLTPQRRTRIKARLEQGYTFDDIKLAIDGCKASGWHMGNNTNGTIYNDLELICRSGEKIEAFGATATRATRHQTRTVRDRIRGLAGGRT